MGLTLVFIAHVSRRRHMIDRMAVIYLGKIVEVGTSESLFLATHPYTGALLSPSCPFPEAAQEGEERQRHLLSGDAPQPRQPTPSLRFHTRCPKAQERCSTSSRELAHADGTAEGSRPHCRYPLTPDGVSARLRAPCAGRRSSHRGPAFATAPTCRPPRERPARLRLAMPPAGIEHASALRRRRLLYPFELTRAPFDEQTTGAPEALLQDARIFLNRIQVTLLDSDRKACELGRLAWALARTEGL